MGKLQVALAAFVAAFCVLAGSPAQATIAPVATTACTSGSVTSETCTLSSQAVSGDVLLVVWSVNTQCAAGSGGAVLTSGTQFQFTANACSAYAWLLAGGSTTAVTVTMGGAAQVYFVAVVEFSGVNTSTPIDQSNASIAGAFASPLTSSSLTPSQSGDAFLTALRYGPGNGAVTYSSSPATATTTVSSTGASGFNVAWGYGVYNSTSAITGTMTYTAGATAQIGAVLLNPAAGGGGATYSCTPNAGVFPCGGPLGFEPYSDLLPKAA